MITMQKSNRLVDVMLAYEVVKGLKNFYPGFDYWWNNKVMPGVMTGDDILICAKEHDRIVGVALGKKRDNDKKLRLVRVDDAYQKRGTGLHLVDGMLTALDCDKPHCTVSEEMLHQYSRAFINHYKFMLDAVNKGMYRKGKLEYVFNSDESVDTNINDDYFLPKDYKHSNAELELHAEVFSNLSLGQ